MKHNKIPSALRHLHKFGSLALQPTKIVNPPITLAVAAAGSFVDTRMTAGNMEHTKRQKWHRPLVSKRVANTLRKKAIRNGTYGTFDADTGIGWEAAWDQPSPLLNNNMNDINSSNTNSSTNTNNEANREKIPWREIIPYKETKRERTRETRAQKIEDLLQTADDKIYEHRKIVQERKPLPGIENTIKQMIQKSRN